MMIEIEARAAHLLRASGRLMMPLSTLHHELTREAGRLVISRRLLLERITRRSDLFRVVEPRVMPWETEHWSPATRDVYATALREGGLAPEPTVTLAAPQPPSYDDAGSSNTLLQRLDAALLCLWDHRADCDDSRTLLTEVMLEVQELSAAMPELVTS